METKEGTKREALRSKLKRLEEEQEEMECLTRRILEEEGEEDREISRLHGIFERMSAKCSTEDSVIRQMIEENQYALREFRRKKMNFEDEFQWEIRERRKRIEDGIEEIQWEMSDIRNREEDNEMKEKP